MSAVARRNTITQMFNAVEYRILKRISPIGPSSCTGRAYVGKSKLQTLFGAQLSRRIQGKTVIDFGCGEGLEAIEMAELGAKFVIGIDMKNDCLEAASRNAMRAGVSNCHFTTRTMERADIIVSLDAFEHFTEPAKILAMMHNLLKSGGEVLISFGPTWYHPYGGHPFSVFPWAHLIFSERALIRWRSDFKSDSVKRFEDVGLNQMSVRRFERLVAQSPLRIAEFEAVPIRAVCRLHCRLTREFFTSIVRCRLVCC